MQRTAVVSTCLFALALLGCQTETKRTNDDFLGQLQPAPAPKKKENHPVPPARQGTGSEFTPAQRARMRAAWRAFLHDDDRWTDLRKEWIAMGSQATQTLVENLVRLMLVSQVDNDAQLLGRARRELMLLGKTAVPTISALLDHPTYVDSSTGDTRRLPTGVVTAFVRILEFDGAVPALVKLTGAKDAWTRRAAMESLGRLQKPQGIPPLVEAATSGRSWIDRLVAVRALAHFGASPRAVSALESALDDSETGVVTEAARSLALTGDAKAIPALERRSGRARQDGDVRVARVCDAAVKALGGAK